MNSIRKWMGAAILATMLVVAGCAGGGSSAHRSFDTPEQAADALAAAAAADDGAAVTALFGPDADEIANSGDPVMDSVVRKKFAEAYAQKHALVPEGDDKRTLVVGADLRLFMPTPVTDAQRLLVDEIGEGPGSRLLLVALSGAGADVLAESSQTLVAALRDDAQFRFAANGSEGIEQVPDTLLAYRYLLSPRLATQPLDAEFLREELAQREADLASPAAGEPTSVGSSSWLVVQSEALSSRHLQLSARLEDRLDGIDLGALLGDVEDGRFGVRDEEPQDDLPL